MGTNGHHAVKLTTRQWQIIDAVLDNEIAVTIVNGDESGITDAARSIRETGWAQAATADGWRPVDHVVEITLQTQRWGVVLEALDRWARVMESEDDGSPSLPSIRAMVTAQLPDSATSAGDA